MTDYDDPNTYDRDPAWEDDDCGPYCQMCKDDEDDEQP
jgi:hypothetical protein